MTINISIEEFFNTWENLENEEDLYENKNKTLKGTIIYENKEYIVLKLKN